MKRERGFTLAELLIALAISSILVVLLANVVNATLSAWQQGRNRLDTFSNARQLIGRISDEISAATAVKDRMEFVENAPELRGASAPVAKETENVFFVAPYPNAGAGDLCVIAYRHDKTNLRLERAFKDSASAWAAPAADRYRLNGYTSGPSALEWRTIADGVVEFELLSYTPDEVLQNTWDSRGTDPGMEGNIPRRVVLRIKVVDDRTLTRLAAMDPSNPQYLATVTRAAREFLAAFKLNGR